MENQEPKARSSQPTVLVIDDSKLVRVSIRRVLKNEFTIVEAVDGEEGWEKLLNDDSIQVVITDNGMPRLDGFGLIERIRKCDNPRLKALPLMMVTGAEKAQTDLREKALALGATDFITKPFDNVQLLARTRSHAKLDKTQRSLEKTTSDLIENSTIDPLTKVSNRRYWIERGNQDLAYATRHKQALTFIGIGVDDFANIESQYGAETSAHIQVWLSKLLQPVLRKEDTLARIKDGVFAVIAPSANRMDAAVLAERMRKKVHTTPFTETVISLPMTVSCGIASVGAVNYTSSEQYLDAVIRLLTQAQTKGGNRSVAAASPKQPAAAPENKPRPSLDTALDLLAQGNTEAIKQFLPSLCSQILPLLEFSDKTLAWGLSEQIGQIKSKIETG